MRVATQAPSICGSHSGLMPSAPSLSYTPALRMRRHHTRTTYTQTITRGFTRQTLGGHSNHGRALTARGATTGGAIETHQRLQYSTFRASLRKGHRVCVCGARDGLECKHGDAAAYYTTRTL